MKHQKFFSIALVLCVLVLLVGCASASTFDGSSVKNEDSYQLDIKTMNGTDTHTLELKQGDMLKIQFETLKGTLNLKITSPDGTALYQGDGTVKEFTVEAPMDGAYPIVVVGQKAKGSIHIDVERAIKTVEPEGTQNPEPEETQDPKPEETKAPELEIKSEEYEPDAFYISHIPDDIFAKMQGRSYKADCTIDREELRYVHILHTGFDGETKEGELVVNKAIADDVLAIFEELYRAKYPIEKVCLVDEYDADDEASMSDNNSSAFNFRTISHTTTISKHGLGMAIDINPLYNPYVKTVNGALSIEPANAAVYVDQSEDHPYRIDHDDLCYKLFTEHGFTWGGDWVHSKDYQHFEKESN